MHFLQLYIYTLLYFDRHQQTISYWLSNIIPFCIFYQSDDGKSKWNQTRQDYCYRGKGLNIV